MNAPLGAEPVPPERPNRGSVLPNMARCLGCWSQAVADLHGPPREQFFDSDPVFCCEDVQSSIL